MIERGPVLRAAVQRLFQGFPAEVIRQAESIGDAHRLLQQLRNQGVNTGPDGLPCKLSLIEGDPDALLRPPQAARHLHAA